MSILITSALIKLQPQNYPSEKRQKLTHCGTQRKANKYEIMDFLHHFALRPNIFIRFYTLNLNINPVSILPIVIKLKCIIRSHLLCGWSVMSSAFEGEMLTMVSNNSLTVSYQRCWKILQ